MARGGQQRRRSELLVPKSLTFQLPTSKRSCGPASMRITVAQRADGRCGRAEEGDEQHRSQAEPRTGRSVLVIHPRLGDRQLAGRRPELHGRGGGGHDVQFGRRHGIPAVEPAVPAAATAATGIVASSYVGRDGGDDVVASSRPTGAAAITSGHVVAGRSTAGRPAELVTGTSPVFSETPRSEAPHSMQNFWPARTSTPHDGHCMPRA